MKSTSRFALLAALGMTVAVTAPTAAFAAKKEKEAAGLPAPKLSDAFRKALAPAEPALQKKDIATADAAIAAARQIASTPDERYVVAQFAINSAQTSGDQAKVLVALDELVAAGEASGRLGQAEKAKFYWFIGQNAYVSKNYPKAEQAITAALAAGSTEADAPAILADSQFRNGKTSEAVATLIKANEARAASGQPVPNEWFARGADMASRAKLPVEFVKITVPWLAAYPVKQNWHDTLFIYRQLGSLSGEPDLDMLRLARAVGALPLSAQSNYIDYALAVYLKFPNEGVDILNEGITAGKLNPATSQNTREMLALSKPKVAADKASIPGAIAAAQKGTYKTAATAGDLLYGYKDYAKAAELYKLALTKPGADVGQGNFRLGLVLGLAGDKAGATAAFNAVTSGPYVPLANYAKVWISNPPAS